MKTYNSYVFRTKDPVIDELRTLTQKEFGTLTRRDLKAVEEGGGPKVGTTAGWFFGKVRRPQNPGIEAYGRTLGYHRPWTKMSEADRASYVKEGRMKK